MNADLTSEKKLYIKQAKTQNELNSFIDYPYSLYKDDLNWVPPLRIEREEFFNPKKNPYFSHSEVVYFLAYRGSRVVGRVTAHEDENWNSHYKSRQGFFGFYESEDDPETASALMNAAENWCRERGLKNIIGPMDFNSNHELGFQTFGFDSPPVFILKYTKEYYIKLFNSLNYHSVENLLSYDVPAQEPLPEKFAKMADRAKKLCGDFKIRNIDMKRLRQELDPILEIYNQAWGENWGFIAMTPGEIDLLAEQFRLIADPEYIYILEKNGTIAGFLFALPDLNQALVSNRSGKLFPLNFIKVYMNFRKINRGSIILLGVKKEFRNTGMELILMERLYSDGRRPPQKYKSIGTGWILESNKPMNAIMNFLGGEIVKKYTVLSKDI